MTCECNGARHVLRDGRWEECSCLLESRARRAWRAAGVPARCDRETWKTLAARFVVPGEVAALGRALKAGGAPGQGLELALRGDEDGRELVAALLARAAIAGGLSALFVDVPALIDRSFAREDAEGPDPTRVGLAVVRLGGEPRHSHNKTALERLVRARRDAVLATVVVGSDPAQAAFELGAHDAVAAFRERFATASIHRRRDP